MRRANPESSAAGRAYRAKVRVAAVGIMLLAFGLLFSSAMRKSATVDEQSHLFRGVAYLEERATHFLLGHPLLGGAISALPLLTETDLQLPIDSTAWDEGDWAISGELFLWQVNEDPLRLIFLGRLPVIWLMLVLGALLYRWGREWAGPIVGLLALGLILLDPNVLAHGRFITGDLPLVLFFTLTLYGFWRWSVRLSQRSSRGFEFLRDRSAGFLLLAGLGFGLASATKFNAVLLLPILGLWAAILAWRWRTAAPLLALLIIGACGWITIWAVYGFVTWRGFLPGGAFWDDVNWQLTYVGEPHGVYLLGEISPTGWLSYFPIAFGLKTPLVTLVLLGITLCLVAIRRADLAGLLLVLAAAIYFAGSMAVALNVGYRYLLPMLPLLILAIGAVLAKNLPQSGRQGLWPLILVGFYALLAIWVWPDYVSYFNVLAGRDSWTTLSDSNVDWGQDLPGLRSWQERSDRPVKLSYFGTAYPSAYGVEAESLPTWPPGPEQMNRDRQAFYPLDPAPGTYAISVTNLHGAVLGADRDTFAEFRDMEPLARIGGSLFVYQVPSRGEPTNVAYSGLTPADLKPELHDQFGTNDIRVRWFDSQSSIVWPDEGGWMVVTGDQKPESGPLAGFWPTEATAEVAGQQLYGLATPPNLEWYGAEFNFGDGLAFLGLQYIEDPGQRVSLLTAWRIKEPTDRPLKLFVHALDESGKILGQWDGLDVDPGSWHSGDVFVQWHKFSLPEASTVQELSIGVYDAVTLDRLREPVSYPFPGR